MTHSSLHSALDVQAAFDVVKAFPVYAIIGRRPSAIYVDADMKAATTGTPSQRLWDLVFEESTAKARDQLQSRPSGLVLVDAEGAGRLVRVAVPTVRTLDTAFSHAQVVLEADLDAIDALEATGFVRAAPSRRLRHPLASPPKTAFGADHPLLRPRRAAP